MNYFQKGGKNETLTSADLKEGLYTALDKLGKKKKVLVVLPDITRFYSRAGELTEIAWEYYGQSLTDILPALGTHYPMTGAEIKRMFGKTPVGLFRGHDWREGIVTLGEVPGELIVLAPGLAEFGEDKEIYYISNPGMGLWSWKQRFHSPGFPTTSS
jgi:nickel-dependent lactate racemase